MSTPFRLIPEAALVQTTTVEPLILPHYSVHAPFILIPDVEEVQTPYVDVSQTPYVDDVHTSNVHRPLQPLDPWRGHPPMRRVEITTISEGLIHMVTAGKATCIVFSDDDLPPNGPNHTCPLYILVGCSSRRASFVLLDNGSALNVCLLATAIALGYAPSDFGPSTHTVRAYDNIRREVMGTLEIELLIGPTTFPTLFQKVKFIHDGGHHSAIWEKCSFILSQCFGSIHVDDDLFRGFTFDEHDSTVVLDMMRNMSYLLGMGLGRRQHEPSEFMAILDHDVPFELGFIPIEADYRYMARVHKERSYKHNQMGSFRDSTLLRRPSFSVLSTSCNEVDEHGIFSEIGHIIDGAVPHDEYIDEMLAMSMSQIDGVVQLELDSPFDIFERVSTTIRDAEIVDFGTTDQPRELRIGLDLSTNERDGLARLLRSYLDVFAWSYEDMPGLDPSIVQHHLPLLPHVRSVKQKLSPKDDFPLLHIDMLVDSTTGHSMLSFMNEFLKTSFITEWGTYCYRVILFGLKNVGTTYQRVATTLFHDMMHRDVEFRLRLNPKKCTFGVTSRKLLGYMSQPTVWDDQCQRAFERIREYLLSPPVLVPPIPGYPLLLYLSVSNVALGYMLAQLDGLGKE
ncbi:hypothetical protein AAG906_011084 [Vitis piasezkii]